jgi:hypothetical protein
MNSVRNIAVNNDDYSLAVDKKTVIEILDNGYI